MITAGNTNHGLVWGWVWAQSKHLTRRELLLLNYLGANAFVREPNPENAPVGQVLFGRSSIAEISAFTRTSQSSVHEALNALQALAYIRRTPRYTPARGGRQRRIIQVDWTDAHDQMRTRVREGEKLPWEYRMTALDAEDYYRANDPQTKRAKLRLIMGEDVG
jgi:hypothetical protein